MNIRRAQIRSTYGFDQSVIAHVSLPAEPWNQGPDPEAEARAERRRRDQNRARQREEIRQMVVKGCTRQDIMGAIEGLSYQALENHLRALGMKTVCKSERMKKMTRNKIKAAILKTGVVDKQELLARTGLSDTTITQHCQDMVREGLIRSGYAKRGRSRIVVYHAIQQEAAE